MKITKTAIESFLREKLSTDDAWALRALEVVYRNQTSAEQATQTTKEHNTIGFSAFDAEILSSFAERRLRGVSLTPKQMTTLRKLMPKYHRQVALVSDTARLHALVEASLAAKDAARVAA